MPEIIQIKKENGYFSLPISIKRLNPIPMDATFIWEDEFEAVSYVKNDPTAYVGQIIYVKSNDTHYKVEENGIVPLCGEGGAVYWEPII